MGKSSTKDSSVTHVRIPNTECEITNDGRVWSIKGNCYRSFKNLDHGLTLTIRTVTKATDSDEMISIDKRYSVSRLVANAFIKNDDPVNKTIVHHKDFNYKNNTPDNLVWVTCSESSRLWKKHRINNPKPVIDWVEGIGITLNGKAVLNV